METSEDRISLVDAVKSSAKSHLFHDLDKLDGPKLFVWEKECMKKVDLLVSNESFASLNSLIKHANLPDNPDDLNNFILKHDIKHVVFVIPPSKKYFERVFACLGAKLTGGTRAYHVRVLTRIPKLLQELFNQNEHVKRRHVSLHSWPFYWIPTFGDVLLNDFAGIKPARLLLTDEYEFFFLSACALNEMFSAREFYWHGQWAQQVMHNLGSLKQPQHDSASIFDQIIVIDRLVDPVTPLLEQFSFSGLIDTIFGINIKGDIEVPDDVLNEKQTISDCPKDSHKTRISLESIDYRKFIHLSMDGVLTETRRSTKELEEMEKTQNEVASMSLENIKNYMPILNELKKSKKLNAQVIHLTSIGHCFQSQPERFGQFACERDILVGNFNQSTVIEFIEELIINAGENAIPALRLICLQSLVYNGLSVKVWSEYQRLLVQSFGPVAVAWCLNLQITGLVCVAGSSSNTRFAQIGNELKRLQCVSDEDSLASFYKGYVPLLVRLVDQKLRDNWKGFETRVNERFKDQQHPASSKSPKRALFVFGGLTRSEIACLRALKHGIQCIFTTGILKDGDMLDFHPYM